MTRLLLKSSSSDSTTMDSIGDVNQFSNFDSLNAETLVPIATNSKIRKMYFAALSALFLALNIGLISGYSAPATYDMSHRRSSRIKPTENEVSWIGSIVGLGLALGGLLSGPLADKFGRKDTLVFNIIPSGLGWLLICYAENALIIITGRFFSGVSCGITMVIVPMYCIEISTPEIRGLLGSSVQGFLVIGHLLSVTIGSFISWDYLALNGLIFSTVGLIFFCFVPESPRWLLSKGRLKEAIWTINKLQGDSVDAEKECNDINKDLENRPQGKMSLSDYNHPTIYKPALIALIIFCFQQFSGANVIFFFSSEIFDISKNFMDPQKATIVLAVVQVVATLTSNLIVDKTGRRVLLILSGSIMAVTISSLGFYYYKSSSDSEFQSSYSWLPLVCLIFFVVGYSAGYGPIPYLLNAELFPTRARSTVGGFLGFLSAFVAFAVTKTFSELKYYLQIYGTFWLYGSFSIVGILFVIFALPETKGKTLEEIERMFESRKQKTNIRIIGVAVIS